LRANAPSQRIAGPSRASSREGRARARNGISTTTVREERTARRSAPPPPTRSAILMSPAKPAPGEGGHAAPPDPATPGLGNPQPGAWVGGLMIRPPPARVVAHQACEQLLPGRIEGIGRLIQHQTRPAVAPASKPQAIRQPPPLSGRENTRRPATARGMVQPHCGQGLFFRASNGSPPRKSRQKEEVFPRRSRRVFKRVTVAEIVRPVRAGSAPPRRHQGRSIRPDTASRPAVRRNSEVFARIHWGR